MPRKYRRHCDECGEYYEGIGARFCSPRCNDNSRRQLADKLPPPSEEIQRVEDDDELRLTVLGSTSIKTVDELLAQADVDNEIWEPLPDSVQLRKWDVATKINDRPAVVPCFYVAVKLRKKWAATDLPTPITLKVTPPKARPRKRNQRVSVHYSDIHFPYHDERALRILYQVLQMVAPDVVVDHGDTLDCESISRWPKDPFHRISLAEEIRAAAEHFGTVHSLTPDARHIWIEGNHEARLRKLIWSLAEDRRGAEILTLDAVRDALTWPSLLGIGALGWEIIEYPKHVLFEDRLILCHGEAVRKHSGQSEKAEYEHYGKGGLSGHTHRTGFFGRRDYNGVHGWWGLGCLCKIRDDYTSFPNWDQGFAVITATDSFDRYAVERVNIFDGTAIFRGEMLQG